MNKDIFIELLRKFNISDITSNLDGSNQNQVVFYYLHHNQKAEENFNFRLINASPGLVVLNRKINSCKISSERIFIADENEFYYLQDFALDMLYPISHQPQFVGITGTNGKSTSVSLCMQIATLFEHKSLSIGTLGIFYCNKPVVEDVSNTTLSYIEFQKYIRKFPVEAVFFEFSSHALHQGRLRDIKLAAAGWTSFTRDHLDYHKDMESYFMAKKLIADKHLIAKDDIFVPRAEIELKNLMKEKKMKFKETIAFEKSTSGNVMGFFLPQYNKNNFEIAYSICKSLWPNIGIVDLQKLTAPAGRFQMLDIKDKKVVIDYAHTPDALEKILLEIKRVYPELKLKVLFGCGGNRDREKRMQMGAIASDLADYIYLTSDNPRDEDPQSIVNDIRTNVLQSHEIILNREVAIKTAVRNLKDNDILLIAGKGHENYQEIKGVKYAFNDATKVLETIENKDV